MNFRIIATVVVITVLVVVAIIFKPTVLGDTGGHGTPKQTNTHGNDFHM